MNERLRTRRSSGSLLARVGGRPLVLTAVALGASLLAFPGGISAQEQEPAQEPAIDSPYRWIPRGVRVGVFGGYLDANRGEARVGPGSTPTVGARFRGRVSSPISLELGVAYGDSDRLQIDPTLPTGPAPVDTLSSQWILAQGGLQLALTGRRTWNSLQPYVIFGAGLLIGISEEGNERFAAADSSDFRYRINVAPVAQAGVGTELLLSERLGIGLEVRDQLRRVETPQGFFRSEVLDQLEALELPIPPDTEWTHNLEFSLTVWRYF